MGPIDYSAAIVNPLQSVLQGFQLGSQLRAQQDARAKERAAAEREKAFMQDISALPTSATGSQDFLRIASKYPDKFEMTSKFWGALNEQKRGYLLDTGAAALRTLSPKADGSYDTDATVATLEERAIAAENSGDKESAKQIRDIASVVKINPAAARATIGMTMIQADKDRGKAIVDAAFGGQGEQTTMQRQYDWLKGLKGQEYADRWLAVETEKFVPVSGVGVFKGSQLLEPSLPAETATVPPPKLKADGNPVGLTPEQYRVTVQAMGKEQTDTWMKRNGIPMIQPMQTATVNGKTFYQINGKWFDNPEGR